MKEGSGTTELVECYGVDTKEPLQVNTLRTELAGVMQVEILLENILCCTDPRKAVMHWKSALQSAVTLKYTCRSMSYLNFAWSGLNSNIFFYFSYKSYES